MTFKTFAAFCISAIALISSASHAGDQPSVVFFGDSLSDTGNRYFDEGMMNTPPYDLALAENLVPSIPYAIGGPTFTNGKVWVEHFARAVGNAGMTQAVLRSNGIAANYAYAGARASNEPPLTPNANQHLTDQVGQYLADVNHQAYPEALHVIFIGGNDVAEAVGAYLLLAQQDPAQAEFVLAWIIRNAATSAFSNVLQLRQAGASRFLLVLAPNAGYSPLFAPGRPFSPLVGHAAASGYNCTIGGDGPSRACPPSSDPTLEQALEATGAEVHILDSQALFDDIIANPAPYGIENTTDHCIAPNMPPYQCADADAYVYWDNIHPTASIHAILAEAAAAVMVN